MSGFYQNQCYEMPLRETGEYVLIVYPAYFNDWREFESGVEGSAIVSPDAFDFTGLNLDTINDANTLEYYRNMPNGRHYKLTLNDDYEEIANKCHLYGSEDFELEDYMLGSDIIDFEEEFE